VVLAPQGKKIGGIKRIFKRILDIHGFLNILWLGGVTWGYRKAGFMTATEISYLNSPN
jgi:hypothetical protein